MLSRTVAADRRGICRLFYGLRNTSLIAVVLISGSSYNVSAADTMQCGSAASQLQQYVNQVNYVANFEYYQGIPNSCMWAQPCMYQKLGMLNAWYMQQTHLVNGWYRQIVTACTDSGSQDLDSDDQTDTRPGKIDEEQIKDLEIDDEDKSVRIKIPSNPKGFKR